MIIDPQVDAALPQTGFLREYVQNYAIRVSDAPEEMALGAALVTVGTLMMKHVYMPWGANRLAPNLWVLVIGPSTFVRKSTTVNMPIDLLAKVARNRVGPNQMTVEGIVQHLHQDPAVVLPVPEFGVFLSMTKKTYAEGLRQLCMQLADGDRIDRRLASSRIQLTQHWVSCVAASALPLLDAHTTIEDWTGGFLARFLPVTGEKRRSYAIPRPPPEGKREALIALLQERKRGTPCAGFDAKADALYHAWYFRSEAHARRSGGLLTQAMYGRLHAAVAKAAMIYQFDMTPNRPAGWKITGRAMRHALALAGIVERTLEVVGRTISLDRDQRDRNTILTIVRDAGREGIAWRELIARSRLLYMRVAEVVESLAQEGLVAREGDDTAARIHYTPGRGGPGGEPAKKRPKYTPVGP